MTSNPKWLVFRPIDTWPGELTEHRKPTLFEADWSSTIETLAREVTHLQGLDPRRYYPQQVVVQLAVPEGAIRQDGQLMAGRRPPEHPGVILTVESPDGPLRFSCDRFEGRWAGRNVDPWRHNLRAIALGLEALRKVERYGLGSGTEQYAGFQALPPATPMGAAMTVDAAARLFAEEAGGGRSAESVLAADERDLGRLFRLAASRLHPDAGGDPERFRRLVEARDLLLGRL